VEDITQIIVMIVFVDMYKYKLMTCINISW